MKFNIAILHLKISEGSYMGNIIGSNGVKPDPSKVEAIVNMRDPEMQERHSASDRNTELLVTVHTRYVYCSSSNEKPIESRRTFRVEHRK